MYMDKLLQTALIYSILFLFRHNMEAQKEFQDRYRATHKGPLLVMFANIKAFLKYTVMKNIPWGVCNTCQQKCLN